MLLVEVGTSVGISASLVQSNLGVTMEGSKLPFRKAECPVPRYHSFGCRVVV